MKKDGMNFGGLLNLLRSSGWCDISSRLLSVSVLQRCSFLFSFSTRRDVIPDEAGRHELWRFVEGEPHQPPQILRPLRQQQAGRLRDILHGEQTRRQVGLLKAHTCRDEHEYLYHGRERVGEVVGHEATVADANDSVPLRRAWKSSHGSGDGGGLVGRGSVGRRGGGVAKEDEVWDERGKAGGEKRTDEGGPLPGGVGAEAVEEEDGVQGRVGAREPEMDDCAVRKRHGDLAEAGRAEGTGVAAVPCERGAQPVLPPPPSTGRRWWRRHAARRRREI